MVTISLVYFLSPSTTYARFFVIGGTISAVTCLAEQHPCKKSLNHAQPSPCPSPSSTMRAAEALTTPCSGASKFRRRQAVTEHRERDLDVCVGTLMAARRSTIQQTYIAVASTTALDRSHVRHDNNDAHATYTHPLQVHKVIFFSTKGKARSLFS